MPFSGSVNCGRQWCRQIATQQRPLRIAGVLVIAGRGHAGDHRVQPAAGAEPLAPLGVACAVVDQVARVNHEPGLGSIAMSFADHPRPVRADVVLSVAKVDERKRLRLVAGRRELEPFAPVRAVADAIGVLRRRREIGEIRGCDSGPDRGCFRSGVVVACSCLGFLAKSGPGVGHGDFGQALLDRTRRSAR